MSGTQVEIPSPDALVNSIFARLPSTEVREEFLRLFLFKYFEGEAGSLTLFDDSERMMAQFMIRSAGPDLETLEIDDSDLSEEARATVAKHCRTR